MTHCASCSAELPEFATFCAHCGNPMAPHAARAAGARNEQVAPVAAPAQPADLADKLAIPEVIEPGRPSPPAANDTPAPESAAPERNLRLARLALVLACVPVLANVAGLLLAGVVMRRIGRNPAAEPRSYRTARLAAAVAAAGLVLVGVFLAARACPARGALRAGPGGDWVPPALGTPSPVNSENPPSTPLRP